MSDPTPVLPSKLLADATRLIANSLSDVVPPEAQRHLLNAQRELLLAVAVIIEHNSSRTVRAPRGRPRKAATGAKGPRRPERVQLD